MNKKKVIAIILLIVIGTIVFWKREWIKKKLGLSKKPETQTSTNTNISESSSQKPAGIDYKENNAFPFKLGDMGTRVKAIQIGLNKFHGANLELDSHFGPLTEAALVKAGYGKTLEADEVNKFLKK